MQAVADVNWVSLVMGVVTSGLLLGMLQLFFGRHKRKSDIANDVVARYEKLVEDLQHDNTLLRQEIADLKTHVANLEARLAEMTVAIRDLPTDSPLRGLLRGIGL